MIHLVAGWCGSWLKMLQEKRNPYGRNKWKKQHCWKSGRALLHSTSNYNYCGLS